MIPSEHVMAKLYYELGKQMTNLSFQHSHKEGEEVRWTKRKTFLELEPQGKDKWFVQNANHRQILKNEIIFDFDRPIEQDKVLQDNDVKKLIVALKKEFWNICIYHSGSKGVHVHLYWLPLSSLNKQDRETFRLATLKHFEWFAGVDLQKASDSCMIAMEHVPHWKTGRTKTLIFSRGVDVWN